MYVCTIHTVRTTDDDAFSAEHENLHQNVMRRSGSGNIASAYVVVQLFLTLDSMGTCTRLVIRDWKVLILASLSHTA